MYLKADQYGNENALNNLGIMYLDQKKYDEAKQMFLRGVQKVIKKLIII